MQCPRCQYENRLGAKFCEECAAPLPRVCANCGTQLSPTGKFCSECAHPAGQATPSPPQRFGTPESYTPKHLAEKILTSKAALEGERKQVTVLFADLKGSMELLADRDPEEARKLLDPVLEHMMEAVHRYEGTVNQVMGDGIMALFGAPLAHEDHAVRACYAALRMQESVKRYAEGIWRSEGARIQIRVGLNAGEVVVRSIGSDLHMDYTAVGQTTHLAARMEQTANPGTILLTADALRLAEGFVQVQPLGLTPVKGLKAPIEVYELTGASPVRTRLQAAAARGLTTFVGRDTEMDALFTALEQAKAGKGQLVAVVGEAGVGKSRLFWEFTHSHRSQGCLVLETTSVSYGKATTHLPVINLLKRYFQIEPQDSVQDIRHKLTGRLLSLDRALEPTLPAFLFLLDIPVNDPEWERLDPPQRRRLTLDAFKRLLLRESRIQPLVLVFEDLHWIDSETQALLETIVESVPKARVLLLISYRPEYTHGWGSKTYYTQLRIDTLTSENAAQLLHTLLGEDVSVQPLKQLLIERTEGNPLFLEETVLTLVETQALSGERFRYRLAQPVETIQVPPTVQVMLAARIDRLPLEDKHLLQVASVVGKDIPFALLQAVAGVSDQTLRRALKRLRTGEFLYEAGFSAEHTFKHALTHEVTYQGLLRERRRELHEQIVNAIEVLYHDRLSEHIEQLAHHAMRGELRQRAVRYLHRAGIKAASRSALHGARSWYEQALDVLATIPETQSSLEEGFEIRAELRTVLNQLGDARQALKRLREAETLADRLNDDYKRGRVAVFMANIHSLLGDPDGALEAGARALAIAQARGDLNIRIPAMTYLGLAHYLRGDYERTIQLAGENLAALPADRMFDYFGNAAPISIFDRALAVMSLAFLGRFDVASEYEAAALRIAEPTHHAFSIGLAHLGSVTLNILSGDWLRAQARIDQGFAVVRPANVGFLLPFFLTISAWVLAEVGEAGEALHRLQEGEQLIRGHEANGLVGFLGWAYHSLGRTCLTLGRLDDAERLAARAVESSPQQFGFAAYALHLLGDIAAHPDRSDTECGEAHYRAALALGEPRQMRPLVAHCHLGLGRLCGHTRQADQARYHLTTATTMYREMGMTYWLQKAEAQMKVLR